MRYAGFVQLVRFVQFLLHVPGEPGVEPWGAALLLLAHVFRVVSRAKCWWFREDDGCPSGAEVLGVFDVGDAETEECDEDDPGGVLSRLGLDDEPGWEVLGLGRFLLRCLVRAAG